MPTLVWWSFSKRSCLVLQQPMWVQCMRGYFDIMWYVCEAYLSPSIFLARMLICNRPFTSTGMLVTCGTAMLQYIQLKTFERNFIQC